MPENYKIPEACVRTTVFCRKTPRNESSGGFQKAGDGNRTHVSSLEGWCSTIEPHLQNYLIAGSRFNRDANPSPCFRPAVFCLRTVLYYASPDFSTVYYEKLLPHFFRKTPCGRSSSAAAHRLAPDSSSGFLCPFGFRSSSLTLPQRLLRSFSSFRLPGSRSAKHIPPFLRYSPSRT
jgi:hypothetical protein